MRTFFRTFSIILLILCMGVIFFFSHQTADTSSKLSSDVIEMIAEKFYPEFSNLSEIEKEQFVESFQFIARKSAHATIFAALGFFAFLTFISYTKLRFFTRCFWAVAISLLYAMSDEIHQYFVPGRSCELRDFLIDSAGAFMAVLLSALLVKMIRPLRRKTAYCGTNKKALIKLNTQLYEKLDDSFLNEKNLQKEIEVYKQKVEILEKEITNRQFAPVNEPDCLEEKMEESKNYQLSDEMQYASQVIGKTVMEVTMLCNEFTQNSQDLTRKELVNLALGRTEVLKSEILKILSLEVSFEEKKNLIEKEQREIFDYFDSLKAQIC